MKTKNTWNIRNYYLAKKYKRGILLQLFASFSGISKESKRHHGDIHLSETWYEASPSDFARGICSNRLFSFWHTLLSFILTVSLYHQKITLAFQLQITKNEEWKEATPQHVSLAHVSPSALAISDNFEYKVFNKLFLLI